MPTPPIIVYPDKTTLTNDLVAAKTIHLVNGYYFNHHDLRLIVAEHGATKIAVVSYPLEKTYHCMFLSLDDMARDNFRDVLMDFHLLPSCNPRRVKYIFIDCLDPSKIGKDSEVALVDGFSVYDIGLYDRQIKW